MQSPRRIIARCEQVCSSLNDGLMDFGVYISEVFPVVRQVNGEAVVLVHTGGFLIESEIWNDEE